jgi:hypothetical protein
MRRPFWISINDLWRWYNTHTGSIKSTCALSSNLFAVLVKCCCLEWFWRSERISNNNGDIANCWAIWWANRAYAHVANRDLPRALLCSQRRMGARCAFIIGFRLFAYSQHISRSTNGRRQIGKSASAVLSFDTTHVGSHMLVITHGSLGYTLDYQIWRKHGLSN